MGHLQTARASASRVGCALAETTRMPGASLRWLPPMTSSVDPQAFNRIALQLLACPERIAAARSSSLTSGPVPAQNPQSQQKRDILIASG